MKNRDNILRVFLLVSVYCFGLYVHATTQPPFNEQTIKISSEQKANLESSSKIIYAHTQQFENLFSDITETNFLDFNLPQIAFWSITYANDLLFKSKFKQYKNHLKTILIRHRKSDLIFPFHYFW